MLYLIRAPPVVFVVECGYDDDENNYDGDDDDDDHDENNYDDDDDDDDGTRTIQLQWVHVMSHYPGTTMRPL